MKSVTFYVGTVTQNVTNIISTLRGKWSINTFIKPLLA